MNKARRQRMDPRAEATKTALIETAEMLFAEAGFDAVSSRQLGAAIGSANNTVVAYHFGSKDDLIVAVYSHRLQDIEAKRTALLAQADAQGRGDDLLTLLRVLWRPLVEQADRHGRLSYVAFLGAVLRSGKGRMIRAARPNYPLTDQIMHRINALLQDMPPDIRSMRWHLATCMALDGISHIRRTIEEGGSSCAETLFEDVLAQAVAALTAQGGGIAESGRKRTLSPKAMSER